MVAEIGQQSIPIAPNTTHHFDEGLTIENHSQFLVDIIFDSAEWQFEYQCNDKRNNVMLGFNIRKVEILDSGDGIQFKYYLNI